MSGMSDLITTLLILAFAVSFGASLAYPLAYKIGKAKGEAIGWQDGYFKRIRDDASKRDEHNGQWKKKGAKA